MKRDRFYVGSVVWESGLSSNAIAVFAYLCYCSDANGNCFPPMRDIGKRCGICENSARKAIAELVRHGMLECVPRFGKSVRGHCRQLSNYYRLAHFPSRVSPEASQPVEPEEKALTADLPPAFCDAAPSTPWEALPPQNEEQLNNKLINKSSLSFALSERACARESEGTNEDREGLEAIFKRCSIELYEDKSFVKAVKLALADMWMSQSITVGGEKISRWRVRKRLEALDIDCLDRVKHAIGSYSGEIASKRHYLISCIYNSPLDENAALAAFRAELDIEKNWRERSKANAEG